jgi:type VI secretion system protein ImpJ
MLGQLLETVIPQRYKTIELRPTSKSIFTGSLTDDGLLEAAEFYLAVRSDVGEDKVIKELPIKAKLSSEERLRSLITAAVRGILIRHLPNPPTDIFEPGRTYFQLEKTGDHWAAVCQDQTLSVYVPPEFTGIQVELMAVSE